jgi:hypothetical protein
MSNKDNNQNESRKGVFFLCNLGAIGGGIMLLIVTKLEVLSWLGDGSWIWGLVLFPFFTLGVVNIGRALFEQYVRDIEMFSPSKRWYWIYSIITVLCLVALSNAFTNLF